MINALVAAVGSCLVTLALSVHFAGRVPLVDVLFSLGTGVLWLALGLRGAYQADRKKERYTR